MKTKCKIRPYYPFNRWVILNANDLSLGWSGSKWVPLFGDVQVSNFDTQADAEREAITIGLEIADGKILPQSIKCPQCGMVSHHPRDIKEKYCGKCNQFHANMKGQ